MEQQNSTITELSQADVQHAINEQLTGFVRYARENRFKVGIAETMDCQALVSRVGIIDKKQLKMAMKGLLCSNADDWLRYDRLFDLYWMYEKGLGSSSATTGGTHERDRSLPASIGQNTGGAAGGHFDVPDASGESNDQTSDGRLSQDGASTTEATAQTNFKQLNNAAELRQMEELA